MKTWLTICAALSVVVTGLVGCGGGDDGPPSSINDGTFSNIETYGGHTYAATSNTFTWAAASALAEGYEGHLVTINDAAENAFLSNKYGNSFGNPWIGLNNLGGTWIWADGTSMGFTNWWPGEPSGGLEHCAMTNWVAPGAWNDGTCSDLRRAIVEW